MSAILADNLLHRLYWRSLSDNRFTIAVYATGTTDAVTQKTGYEVQNVFDNNGHTSFKLPSSTQVDIVLTFKQNMFTNGLAFYGHNLNSGQGLKVQYKADSGSYAVLIPDAPNVSDGVFKPASDRYHAFAGYQPAALEFDTLKITTVGWDTTSFLSCMSLGMWLDEGINIAAPFTAPYYAPVELDQKRNSKGNMLGNQVRKIPQKLSLNINNLSESDLETVGTSSSYKALFYNSDVSPNRNFVEYIGDYVSRYPFFVMWNTGLSTDTAAIQQADRNQVYYCVVDKTIKQPAFRTPTALSWKIGLMGYIT